MAPLLRKAPFDKVVEKASPDAGCRIIYSSSKPSSFSSHRFSGLDSPEGKGGWLWRSHSADPGRKIAFIYLEQPPAGEHAYAADPAPRKRRRGDAGEPREY